MIGLAWYGTGNSITWLKCEPAICFHRHQTIARGCGLCVCACMCVCVCACVCVCDVKWWDAVVVLDSDDVMG